jgi:hypothetical protein
VVAPYPNNEQTPSIREWGGFDSMEAVTTPPMFLNVVASSVV